MAIGARKKIKGALNSSVLQERRKKRALHLFTNRDDERDLLKRFFFTISATGEELEKPILSFWGVGGVGKSTLLTRAWEEFKAGNPESPLHLISLDLDSDKSESLSLVELLWWLRSQAYETGKVSFHFFDLLYVKYKKMNGEAVDIKTGPLRSLGEKIRDNSPDWGTIGEALDVTSRVIDVLGSAAEASAAAVTVSKIINYGWKANRQRSLASEFKFDLGSLDNLNFADYERILPEVLAVEMGRYLTKKNQTICIALDGYERVRKPVEKLLVEHFFSPLLTNSDFYSYVGILLMGRNELDWSEYDSALQELLDEGSDEHWNPYLDQHRLGGLSKNYAEQFLDVAVRLYQEERRDDLAELVQDNREEIAAASMETGTEGIESYHPFHLDLCLEQIEKQLAGFDAGKHLGRTPKELQNRFLKYLDDNSREWHYAFALCGEFDEELFGYLVDRKSITGSLQEFYRFVFGCSYVTPQTNEDSFKFHRLMQNSLILDIASRHDFDRDVLKRSVLDKLIGFYNDRFVGPTLEVLVQNGAKHYQRATDMLINSVRANVISLDVASQKTMEWDKPYSSALLPVRELCTRKWLNLKIELLGEGCLQAAESLYALGLMLAEQGKSDEAEQTLKSALEIRVELFGEDHSQVSAIRHNIALVLKAKGNYEEARKQLSKSLWIKRDTESTPEDKATKFNNDAQILMTQHNYNGAVRLLCRSLAMRLNQYGENSHELIPVVDNLAISMDKLGNYHFAYALHSKSLEIKRAYYGNIHLSIAKSLSYMGFIMDVYAKYRAAENMLRESLDIYRQVLGNDYPEVATSMQNLAVVLAQTQQYGESEMLFREALSLKRKTSTETLDVSDCLYDLALVMEELDRYQEAESLLREGLQIARSVAGDHDDRVGHVVRSLIKVIRRQGKRDEEVESLSSAWDGSDPFCAAATAFDLDSKIEDMALINDAKEITTTAEASKYDSRSLRFKSRIDRAYSMAVLFERLEALDEEVAIETSLKDILDEINIECDEIPTNSIDPYDNAEPYYKTKIYIPSRVASMIDSIDAGSCLDPYEHFEEWNVKEGVAIANGCGYLDFSMEAMLAWAKIPFLRVDDLGDLHYSIFCPEVGERDALKISGVLEGVPSFDLDDDILANVDTKIDFKGWNMDHDWSETSKRLNLLALQPTVEDQERDNDADEKLTEVDKDIPF